MAVRMQEMSKTYQYRKVMKPLLERKRRARINKCLDELKDLMSECLVQQGENVVRLEKADILELTVDHLKRLRGKVNTNVNSGISNDNHHSFRSGYVHAANEVSRTLACYPGVDIFLGTKVMAHLGHRLIQIEKQKHNHHQEINNNITKSSSSSSSSTTSLPVNSPLRVYCGNNNNNSGQKIDQNDYVVRNENYTITQNNNQQLSPVSSGYGSDNESVSPSVSSLSNNYHNYEGNISSNSNYHHQGLLKIANPTIMPIDETSTKDIWRPW